MYTSIYRERDREKEGEREEEREREKERERERERERWREREGQACLVHVGASASPAYRLVLKLEFHLCVFTGVEVKRLDTPAATATEHRLQRST